MDDKTSQGQNMYAIIFTIIAILALIGIVLLLFWRIQAADTLPDQVIQNVTANTAPTVDAYSLYDNESTDVLLADETTSNQNPLVLTEGVNDNLYATFTASDVNGCEDIDQISSYAITASESTVSCNIGVSEPNWEGCYQHVGTTNTLPSVTFSDQCVTGGSDLSVAGTINPDASGTGGPAIYDLSPSYIATATDIGSPNEVDNWTSTLTVTDETAPELTATSTVTFETASLEALSFSNSAVNYGVVALGSGASGGVEPITVTNIGNRIVVADFVSDGNLLCSGAGQLLDDDAEVEDYIFLVGNGLDLDTAAGDDSSNPYGARPNDDNVVKFVTDASDGIAVSLDQTANQGAISEFSESLYFYLTATQDSVLAPSGVCNNVITFTASADYGV